MKRWQKLNETLITLTLRSFACPVMLNASVYVFFVWDACVCLASVHVDDVCWPVLRRFGGVVDVLKALAAVWVGVWNPSLCGAANILAVPSSSLALVLFIPMLYNDSLSLISQQRFTVLWENWSISFAKIEISLLSRLIWGCDRWLIIVLCLHVSICSPNSPMLGATSATGLR